jgi:hypothetical protein
MGMWHMAAMVYFAKVVWWPLWSDMKWHMTLSLGLVDTCQIQLKSMFTYTKIVTAIDHVWLVVWNIFSHLIIGNHDPNWLIFIRGVETTNQYVVAHPRNPKSVISLALARGISEADPLIPWVN